MLKRRMRIGVVVAALAVGLVGVSACGRFGDRAAPDAMGEPVAGATTVDATGAEEAVLAAMGFEAAAQVEPGIGPTPDPSAGPGSGKDRANRPHRRPLTVFLHRNVLHGEVVVQTKDGPQTVAVQRGTVTAIDDRSITVKSADGFTATWTFGDPLHVIEHRTTIKPTDVTVGAEVGVAGPKGTARLIAIR